MVRSQHFRRLSSRSNEDLKTIEEPYWLQVLSTRIAIGLMVAFFLLPSAAADPRQLYQPGFLASPYASTYAAGVSPQMYAPVYAEPSAEMYMPQAIPGAYTYVYEEQEQSTGGWSDVRAVVR